MYKCIIHPTDLQEDHLDYCEQAIKLAKDLGAEIYLLHALHIPNSWQFAQGLGFAETEPLPIEDAKIVMEALADRFNLSHENMLIKQHGLKQSILEIVEELQADLLIIGSTSNHFFQNEILQMCHYISQHSACDTLLLHQK